MSFLNKIYEKSPVCIQNTLISLYGYYRKDRRFGGVFKEYVKQFNSRNSFSKKQWHDYQTEQLRTLLTHAYTNVPFYTKLYKNSGFALQDFEAFELKDLKKLPYLEKEDLRNFGKTTLLSKVRDKGVFYASSGSTGTPTSIYFSKKFHQAWSAAYEVRVRQWAGVNNTMSRGMIGGRKIVAAADQKPPFYRYNKAEKQTYFSAYHISYKNVNNYVEGLKKHKVDYLVGYAMSIYFLADFILQKKLQVSKMCAVLTSSEKLTSEMRITIEKVFQCKVYDAYSGLEACGLISENSFGELLFSPDTGIMEVINQQGEDVANGQTGEVIATGFLNYDQPLIRYRIGDRVILAANQQSLSTMQMPVISEIEGRVEDVVISYDGKKMVRFHSLFTDVPHLKLGQVVQNSFTDFEINLVVEKDFSNKIEMVILERLKKQLGNTIIVKFKYLSEIPKNKNGKYQAVVSNLKK